MSSVEEQVAGQISEIIRQRKKRLPLVEGVLKRCSSLQEAMTAVRSSIEQLQQNSTENEMLTATCQQCLDVLLNHRGKIADIEQQALLARKRFSRDTVNIGFGGPKGMGKSFLLQKLSGLTNNEVPSADGLPVTAVRSVIQNSPDNCAKVVFHTPESFLQQRIWPLCRSLSINSPHTLSEFQSMKLPETQNSSDRSFQCCNKIREYQSALPEYRDLLTGEEKTIALSELRPYVTYRLPSPHDDKSTVPNHVYVAVSSVTIYCEFPQTAVKSLKLIDLPGLGELDPSLESIHTEGFKDNVDLCLFIRRPSGNRPDWDQEAQSALDTLTRNCPAGHPSDFVILVINGGGCKPDYVTIMEKDARDKLGDRYTILTTDKSDSQGLSAEVLSRALDHLSQKLPKSDNALFLGISESLNSLSRTIADFCDEAKRTLRQYGQGEDSEELRRHAAEQALRRFARLSLDIRRSIEKRAAKQEDLREVIDSLDRIKEEILEYFNNGMQEGSRENWLEMAIERYAQDNALNKVQTDMINQMRVQIAQRFSLELDSVYKDYIIHEILEKTVAALNDAKVLNNMLSEDSAEKNLKSFLSYLDNTELPVPQMREAVEGLITLKIEHNAQFYPRAYDPIRSLKDIADVMKIEGNTLEERCENLYTNLVDMGTRTIIDIRNKIIEETRNNLFNILLVAYEKFEDSIIRNDNAKEEWIRFFKSYYNDIITSDKKANISYLLNETLKQLSALRDRASSAV